MRTDFGASEQGRKSAALWTVISIFFVLSLLWLIGPPVAHSQSGMTTATTTVSPATTVAPADMVTPTETVTETDTLVPPTDTPVPLTEEPADEPTEEPAEELTMEPTEAPTPEPIEEPTEEPTEEPIPEPVTEPTKELTPTDTPTPEPTQTDTPVPTDTLAPPTATATPALTPLQKLFSSLQERPQQRWPCLIGLVVLIALASLFLWKTLRRQPPPEKEPVPPTPPVTLPPQVRLGVPYLESLSRPGGQIMFRLESLPVTVGRSPDNDLIIDEQYNGWEAVSRRHAEIREDNGRYVLIDNNSMNGVYVNGRRTGKNLLKDGFRVSFGQVEFIFRENIGREDPMSEDSRVKGAH